MSRNVLYIAVMALVSYTIRVLPLTLIRNCLLYTSPSPRDGATSRMPSSA